MLGYELDLDTLREVLTRFGLRSSYDHTFDLIYGPAKPKELDLFLSPEAP